MSHKNEATEEILGWDSLTVGQLVARFPQTAKVFERLGIDYCCDGKRTLQKAASNKGVEWNGLQEELLETLEAGKEDSSPSWNHASLVALINHIETTHHQFIRSESPRLRALAQKVARVHGPRHPELIGLSEKVEHLFLVLEEHLIEEEKGFFPLCKKWEETGMDISLAPRLAFELERLEQDHHDVGKILEAIHKLTSGYRLPEDACNSYRALFHGLEKMEKDIHTHVHKENNIVHGRVMAALGKEGKFKDAPDFCCRG